MENMKNVSKKRSLELEILELESKLTPALLDKDGNPIDPSTSGAEGAEC